MRIVFFLSRAIGSEKWNELFRGARISETTRWAVFIGVIPHIPCISRTRSKKRPICHQCIGFPRGFTRGDPRAPTEERLWRRAGAGFRASAGEFSESSGLGGFFDGFLRVGIHPNGAEKISSVKNHDGKIYKIFSNSHDGWVFEGYQSEQLGLFPDRSQFCFPI